MKLIENGDLDAEVVFVSKYFHDDFVKLERNLRKVIDQRLHNYKENIVLVYGDLCLGLTGQMKELCEDYGVVKIDALNCVDCILGGKGKYLEVDPSRELFFISAGMMDVFGYVRRAMKREGIDEEKAIKTLFEDMKGFVVLDTLEDTSKLIDEINKQDTGLEIMQIRNVGCKNVKYVIQEAIEKASE